MPTDLPADGLYCFYQRGETCPAVHGLRIVRVGINEKDGNFRQRLRQHYRGNRKGSVFRKHVGAALLVRQQADAAPIRAWVREQGPMEEVERLVTVTLARDFTFRCIAVPNRAQRARFEELLVGTLSYHPPCPPSADWLGRWSPNASIITSGLWNVEHVGSQRSLNDPNWLSEFQHLVDAELQRHKGVAE